MFEEFSDRILFAEGMKDEWFAFLDDDEIHTITAGGLWEAYVMTGAHFFKELAS